jgi:phosphoinositide-3-kinase regulatory subunit 4
MEITTEYQHPLEYGVISALCPSSHWVVVGTTTSTLSIWDLRFGLIVKSWKISGRITAIQLHPNRGKGLWLMVSTIRSDDEAPFINVYDIESSKLVETYEVRATKPTNNPLPIPEIDVTADKAALIAQLSADDETPFVSDSTEEHAVPSVLAIMVGQAFASLVSPPLEGGLMSVPERSTPTQPGWMVTAGDDRVVRYWDLAKVSDSFVVCGSQKDRDVSFKYVNILI